MATLRAKLDVYPLENYILRPLDGPLAAVLGGGGGGNVTGNKNNSSGGNNNSGGGNAAEQRRRVRTPLEKLVTLKNRVHVERQTVQSVEGVCVVHLHHHPHVLLLRQTLRRNRDAAGQRIVPTSQTNADVSYRLPGGRCRRGEAEEACLLRKLGRCLLSEAKQAVTGAGAAASATSASPSSAAAAAITAQQQQQQQQQQALLYGGSSGGGGSAHLGGLIVGDATTSDAATLGDGAGGMAVTSEASAYFRVGEVLARWYRPHYSPLLYPYVPPHLSLAAMKEVRSIYLVHLEPMAYLRIAHTDVELVAVPLFDLHDNAGKYGPVLAALPALLSCLIINYCNAEY